MVKFLTEERLELIDINACTSIYGNDNEQKGGDGALHLAALDDSSEKIAEYLINAQCDVGMVDANVSPS